MMPDDKKYKLWENLNKSGYYTKSYDEFQTQFSTPEKQSALYENLSSNGYYTKSGDEFINQFFSTPEPVKKKEEAQTQSPQNFPEGLVELPPKKIALRVAYPSKSLDTQFQSTADIRETIVGAGQAQEAKEIYFNGKTEQVPLSKVKVVNGVKVFPLSDGTWVKWYNDKWIKSNYQGEPETKEYSQVETQRPIKLSDDEITQLRTLDYTIEQGKKKVDALTQQYESSPVSALGGKPADLQLAEMEVRADEQKKTDLENTAKFRDSENYYRFYNTDNYKEKAVAKQDMDAELQNFMDNEMVFRKDIVNPEFSAGEFVGKKYEDLDETAKAVVLNKYMEKYIPAETLQSHLAANNIDLDMGVAPAAGREFVKGVMNTTSSILDGAAYKNSTADVLNATYAKAKNKLISKSEYERKFSEISEEILSKLDNGVYQSDYPLPGMQPMEKTIVPAANRAGTKEVYQYSEDQVQRWLSKMPTYDEAIKGVDSPYRYENGLLGDWAEGIENYANSMKNNPLLKDNLAVKTFGGLGSSIPFIASSVLTSGLSNAGALSTALVGGLANASSAYDQAIQGGATPDEAMKVFIGGLGVGATEAIPIERLLNRIGASNKIVTALTQGTEESIQETLSSLGNDALTKLIYDSSQEIGANVSSDAGIGFLTGIIMGGGVTLFKRKDVTPEQKAIVEEAMSRVNNLAQDIGQKAISEPVEPPTPETEEVVAEEEIVEPVAPEEELAPVIEEVEQKKEVQEVKERLSQREIEATDEEIDEIASMYMAEQEEENPASIDEVIDTYQREKEAMLEEVGEPIVEEKVEPEKKEEKPTELEKQIAEKKRVLEEAKMKAAPAVGMKLSMADKTPILKSQQFFSAQAQESRKKNKQGVSYREMPVVTNSQDEIVHMGGKVPNKVKAKIESGEYKTETVKVVLDKRLNPVRIVRESQWRNRKAPLNQVQKLSRKVAEATDAITLYDMAQKYFIAGGKIPYGVMQGLFGVKGKGEVSDRKVKGEVGAKSSTLIDKKNTKTKLDGLVENVHQFIRDELGDEVADMVDITELTTEVEDVVKNFGSRVDMARDLLKRYKLDDESLQEEADREAYEALIEEQERQEVVREGEAAEQAEQLFTESARMADEILFEMTEDEQAEFFAIIDKHTDPDGRVDYKAVMAEFEELPKIKNLSDEKEGIEQAEDIENRADSNISKKDTSIEDRISEQKRIIQDAKDKLNKLGVADDQNQARAELMAAYTDLAVLLIQKGLRNAVEFAKELGEDLTDIIQEAWDKAWAENMPEEKQPPKPPKEREKTLLNRAFSGLTAQENETLKNAIEAQGLNTPVQSWAEGKAKAQALIAEVGIEGALAAVKNGLVMNAEKAYVFAEAVDAINNEMAITTDEARLSELAQMEAEMLNMFSMEATSAGRFISALRDIYENADFRYNADYKIEEFKKANNGEISPEQEALIRDYDRKLKDLTEKLNEANRRLREQEFADDVDRIVQDVERTGRSNVTREEIEQAVQAGVEKEVNKIYEKLPTARKQKVDKWIKKLDAFEKSLNSRAYSTVVPVAPAIIIGGVKIIKASLKAGASIADAVERGIQHITDKHGRKWNDEAFRADMMAQFEGEDVEAGVSKKAPQPSVDEAGVLVIPNKLIRDLVERGFNTPETLVAEVMKIVQEVKPDVTEREVRDAISNYGKTVDLTKDEISKNVRKIKTLLRLISGLEDVRQGKRPKRSGLQRDETTPQERSLIKQLREAMKDLPVDPVQDAKRQKSALDIMEKRLLNLIEDLQKEINDGRRAVKEKKTVALTQRILDLQEQVRELRKTHKEIFGDKQLTDEQRVKMAVNALNKSIDAIRNKIAAGDTSTATRESKTPITDEIRALRAEREALQDTLNQMRKAQQPQLSPEQKKAEARLKQLDRLMAEAERKIMAGDTSRKAKPEPSRDPRVIAKQERYNELRKQLQEMRDAVGMTDAENLARLKKLYQKQIAEYEDRIRRKDFSKKPKKVTELDEEAARLKAEKQAVKDKLDMMVYEQELRNRTKAQKVIDFLLDVWNLTRGLRATFDMSFILMQGGFYAIAHPINAAKGIATAMKAFASKSAADKFEWKVKTMPEYTQLREDKLAFTETDQKQSKKEEMFITGLTNHIWDMLGYPLKYISQSAYERWKLMNPPKAFERAAVAYLNTVRILRWQQANQMLYEKGKNRTDNTQDFKDVADMINTFTGRASLGKAEQMSKYLALVFFSPKMWASVMKTFTPYAFYHFGKMTSTGPDGKREVSVAQKMAMMDYIKFVGLTTAMVLFVKAAFEDDDEVEVVTDPKSSDFMKIRVGDTRIDPWGGRIQSVVLQSRLFLEAIGRDAYTSTKTGGSYPLGVPYKSPTALELLTTRAVNKFSPSMKLVYTRLIANKDKQGNLVDKYGQPIEMSDEMLMNLYPIYFETFNEIGKAHDPYMAGFLDFFALLGLGVQVYEPQKPKGIPIK